MNVDTARTRDRTETQMIISMPIRYEVLVENKMHPSMPMESSGGEFVDVVVEEVEPADAPIATRWHDRLDHASRETRWHRGKHFERARMDCDGGEGSVTAEWLREACLKINVVENPLLWDESDFHLRRAIERLFDDKAVKSGREAGIAMANARAADLISVDGAIWIACEEPKYQVCERWMRPNIQVSQTDVWSETSRSNSVFHPADGFDNVVESMLRIHGRAPEGNEIDEIEVLIPESVRFTDRDAFIVYARGLVESEWKQPMEACGERIRRCSREHIVAWVDLRDALDRVMASRTESGLEALASALAAFRPHGGLYVPEEIDRALFRWGLARGAAKYVGGANPIREVELKAHSVASSGDDRVG